MKKQLLLIWFTLSLSAGVLAFGDFFSDITNGMKSGNAKLIADHFTPSLELNVPGGEGLFSKVQAEAILRDFFIKNPVKTFAPKHEGMARDGSKFNIGVLETLTGTFRTYYFAKKTDTGFLIKEFRIEKDN